MTKKNSYQSSNNLLWIICSVLALAGIGISIHALLNFNSAKVIVEWTTASELDTVGFNLLRGETSIGTFEQVNVSLIPASSDSLTGNSYQYEDLDATAGHTYFYMLEEIESSGSANQHGPITVKATSPAKIELMIGVMLMVGALIYLILLFRDSKAQESQNL